MGMFDTIQCSDPMPFNDDMVALGLNVRDWSFQTKDLNDVMSLYILQDGILYERRYKESKWIEPDFSREPRAGNFGHMEYTGEYLEDTKHHGVINMYDYRPNVMGWDCYIEYAVTFTDGKVTEIKLTEFRKEDAAPRIERDKLFWDRIETSSALWYNKYIFYTKAYRFFRLRLIKLIGVIRQLCDFLVRKLP